ASRKAKQPLASIWKVQDATIQLHLESAGVAPAVFGLWPKTFRHETRKLFGEAFDLEDQSAGRRLERPGRSRSPFWRNRCDQGARCSYNTDLTQIFSCFTPPMASIG